MVYCVVGHIFEAYQHFLTCVGRQINPLLNPTWDVPSPAKPCVSPAKAVPIRVLVGRIRAPQDIPSVAAIGRNFHIGIIPFPLNIMPQPEFQGGRWQTCQIEGAG